MENCSTLIDNVSEQTSLFKVLANKTWFLFGFFLILIAMIASIIIHITIYFKNQSEQDFQSKKQNQKSTKRWEDPKKISPLSRSLYLQLMKLKSSLVERETEPLYRSTKSEISLSTNASLAIKSI
ncbi:hypothetical protein NH340_JMT00057 [Sarcoptes scabiei]|nr:hypothetical protein NH340_JMT00057 [Sarcoptes scabiei]